MWFTKKKPAHGPLVWMIQKKGSNPALFLGVCKHDLVTLGNWKACFRFSDMDSAGLMIYWMIQAGKVKPGEYEAVPVQLQVEEKKS
jgi:hypothetical protein